LASKRSGDATPLIAIQDGDPGAWDFKSTMRDIEHKLNTKQRIPAFNFGKEITEYIGDGFKTRQQPLLPR
jgi:hypothetical protein